MLSQFLGDGLTRGPAKKQLRERARGALRGRIEITDDFDESPDDIAEAFGAR